MIEIWAETLKKFLEQAPDIKPLPYEEAEAFYAHGYSLYQVGDSKKAKEIFELLCSQWPSEFKYWFALASARQEEKEFTKALASWAMAAILEKEDPYPHFHAAECYLSLNQLEEAHLALAAALRRVGEEISLKEKILVLCEQWGLKQCSA